MDNITNDIALFIDPALKRKQEDCVVCWENDCQYWTQLGCGHQLCAQCFINISVCPLRCCDSDSNARVIQCF